MVDNNALLSEILQWVVRVETKIDDYNALRDKVDKAYNLAVSADETASRLDDNLKWLWRLVGGLVIVAIVSTVIVKGG